MLDRNLNSGARWLAAGVDHIVTIERVLNDPRNFSRLGQVSTEALHHALDNGDSRLWVYCEDDQVLAFAYLTGMESRTPKLEEFAALREGEGVGTRSLKALLANLRATGTYDHIWLHVVTTNHRAIHIYRKLGFGHPTSIPGGWTDRHGTVVDIYRFWADLRPQSDASA